MKVAHHNKDLPEAGEDLLRLASGFEKEQEFDKAEKLYLRYLKKIPGSEHAFSRLMIIYRKQRNVEKEVEIIDRAIKTFSEIFKKTIKIAPTKKTVELSKKLMKAMGLVNAKGMELNEREPLHKWKKRRSTLEKKLPARRKR